MFPLLYMLLMVCAVTTRGDNATLSDDTCRVLPWEAALEDWATADRNTTSRQGRIMALPPTQGYYVSDRIDLVPPPPPRSQMMHRGPYPAHSSSHHGSHSHPPNYRPSSSGGPQTYHPPNPPSPPGPSYPSNPPSPSSPSYNPSGPSYSQPAPSGPSHSGQGSPGPSSPSSLPYDEWQATPPPPPGASKIVNRPPNPYKDQFKPSYPPLSPAIPVQSVADRVDTPPPAPHKQVSETDLHLLRAIEKLVYRVDSMEKRLRKMEESMLYIVAGNKPDQKPEPCPGAEWSRVGGGCYHVSSEAANWKGASFACRKLKANLLELGDDERASFVAGLLADQRYKGSAFWTGGLNPGLLWIWSHGATPVANGTSADQAELVQGEGRCLALVYQTPDNYVYRGEDCAVRHRYVCERAEDPHLLSNEISRAARALRGALREGGRKTKLLWTDDN